MLIEVKSAQNDESELKGAKRFEFNTAERLTRLPAYLALMVVGIAAYIRSITAAQARLPETDRAEGAEGESVNAPPAQETDDLAVAGIDDTETGGIEGEGGRRGLGLDGEMPGPPPSWCRSIRAFILSSRQSLPPGAIPSRRQRYCSFP